MKTSHGIELLKFSIGKVLKKYVKWFLKMCGNPAVMYMSWFNICVSVTYVMYLMYDVRDVI